MGQYDRPLLADSQKQQNHRITGRLSRVTTTTRVEDTTRDYSVIPRGSTRSNQGYSWVSKVWQWLTHPLRGG
jgi:hypothetical protein